MKAYITELGKYKLSDMPIEEVGANDVLVSLKVAGLNRRDLSIANRMGNNKAPLVLGSDVAVVIESLRKNVRAVSMRDEVNINSALRWDKKSDALPVEFEIPWRPDHETPAQRSVVPQEQVEPEPT